MSRFLDPYYFVNSLLLLAYGGLRAYFVALTPERSKHSRFNDHQDLVAWEKQLVLLALASIAWKGLRMRSWDDVAQHLFATGKVLVTLTAIFFDLRLAMLYALVCVACWVVFPQPIMQMTTGQATDAVTRLTPSLMKDWVLRPDEDWVVLFYTENHTNSIAMAPAFVEVADKYSSEALSFGVMDACLWPSFCKELKLRANSWSNQLPAVVRYVGGREQARLPVPKTGEDLGVRFNYYTQKEIVRKLALDGAPGIGKAGKKQR